MSCGFTLSGDEALAFSGQTYPQKMSDDYRARAADARPGAVDDRLRRLARIRLCPVVGNEQPPFPSCLGRR